MTTEQEPKMHWFTFWVVWALLSLFILTCTNVILYWVFNIIWNPTNEDYWFGLFHGILLLFLGFISFSTIYNQAKEKLKKQGETFP